MYKCNNIYARMKKNEFFILFIFPFQQDLFYAVLLNLLHLLELIYNTSDSSH